MINEDIKIADLLTQYPFLMDLLIERNKVFKNLQNPIVFKTVGKFAKLKDVSKNSGENLEELIAFIENEIRARTD
ncbi:MAG: DUF1858 domain-containing protein [Spirochaetia bacterium]|nr:DUF1858 domain-containing protein [Spirochaetia bacterium]